MAPRSTPRWLVYLGLTTVIFLWGFNTVALKASFRDWDPLGFSALRFLMMAPLAVGIAAARGASLRVERRDLPLLLAAAACGSGVYQYFYILGLAHTTAFASALLSSLAPIFTLVLAVALGQERSRSGRWIGALIAILGVAVFEGAFSGRAAIGLGDLLTLAGAAIFAGYNVLAGRLLGRYSPASLIAITLTLGAAMIVPGGLWNLAHQDFSRISSTDWALLAYSTVFPMVLGYQLWSWGIAKIGAGPASLFNFAVPIVAGLAAMIFLHTRLTAYEIVGAAVCIGGLAASQILARFSLTTPLANLWALITVPAER